MQTEAIVNELETTDGQAVERVDREATPRAAPGDLLAYLAALGLGATAMYFLDPNRGRRRRHLVRDKVVHAAKETSEGIGKTARDLSNRSRGVSMKARRLIESDETDDAVLVGRVRAELGRV